MVMDENKDVEIKNSGEELCEKEKSAAEHNSAAANSEKYNIEAVFGVSLSGDDTAKGAKNVSGNKKGTREKNSGISAAQDDTAPDMTPMSLRDDYKTKIILIRHGQSEGNARKLYLGHTDLDLTDKGRAQAQRTALLLKDVKIDAIYASDLQRAYNTAAAFARERGLDVHGEERLREVFLGKWEGCPCEELYTTYKEQFFGEWVEHFGLSRPPEGESVAEAAERFTARMKEIAEENEGKTVLIAAHAAVIRASYARVLGIPFEQLGPDFPFPANASASVVYYDGEKFVPGEYSHAAHLTDLR